MSFEEFFGLDRNQIIERIFNDLWLIQFQRNFLAMWSKWKELRLNREVSISPPPAAREKKLPDDKARKVLEKAKLKQFSILKDDLVFLDKSKVLELWRETIEERRDDFKSSNKMVYEIFTELPYLKEDYAIELVL